MRLDTERAAAAYAPVAAQLGVTTAEAADACLSVTTSNMVSRILPYLAAHGLDPQNVTLVLFGGNGALHGPLLADEIGINSIVVPPAPSVFCAQGGVVTTLTHDVISVVQGSAVTDELIAEEFKKLQAETLIWLSNQIEADQLVCVDHEFWAELRYKGQSFQVAVSVPAHADGAFPALASIADRFHDEHQRLYSHCDRSAAVEFVELRVRVRGNLPTPPEPHATHEPKANIAVAGRRDIRISGKLYPSAASYRRKDITAGSMVEGPCIIEEDDSTILVPAAFTACALTTGALAMTRRH